jgi:hypothetical protein
MQPKSRSTRVMAYGAEPLVELAGKLDRARLAAVGDELEDARAQRVADGLEQDCVDRIR